MMGKTGSLSSAGFWFRGHCLGSGTLLSPQNFGTKVPVGKPFAQEVPSQGLIRRHSNRPVLSDYAGCLHHP